MTRIRLTIVLALLALAGCATVPEPLQGEFGATLMPEQATRADEGTRVRWGGTVVETTPEAGQTCIEILSRELDGSARPKQTDVDHGRFIACRGEFMDPEVFTNGREVTVTGRLSGFRDGTIGAFEYRYPVVDARTVYLWPERVDTYWYGHGYYGWGYPYYWPYYRYPMFYGHYIYRPVPRPLPHRSAPAQPRSGGKEKP